MKLPRRKVLALAAGAAVSPAYIHAAGAETGRPLAERLADYAEALRYENLDAATVEQTGSINANHLREFPSPVTLFSPVGRVRAGHILADAGRGLARLSHARLPTGVAGREAEQEEDEAGKDLGHRASFPSFVGQRAPGAGVSRRPASPARRRFVRAARGSSSSWRHRQTRTSLPSVGATCAFGSTTAA